MPSPAERVQDIAARLSAAGFAPQVTDLDDHTRIETEVPDQVPAEPWRQFLAALALADWWGFAIGSKSGCFAWAAVNKNTPAAARTARGHDRQL
ncbi:hypothetical protein ACIHFE_14060 [Streptomyces sp. NPDC052396]|uniref:hypothetical protein n=1 Tax=Streptomyces sp. NPDC052396 TaxID=3365689 RepID=UPI0037D8D86D